MHSKKTGRSVKIKENWDKICRLLELNSVSSSTLFKTMGASFSEVNIYFHLWKCEWYGIDPFEKLEITHTRILFLSGQDSKMHTEHSGLQIFEIVSFA